MGRLIAKMNEEYGQVELKYIPEYSDGTVRQSQEYRTEQGWVKPRAYQCWAAKIPCQRQAGTGSLQDRRQRSSAPNPRWSGLPGIGCTSDRGSQR